MTGEDVLRGLAEDCKRNVAAAAPEYRHDAILGARPFMTGALIALTRTRAITHPHPLQLLEELLAPIEQPLVDLGIIENVSATLESRITSGLAPADEEPEG